MSVALLVEYENQALNELLPLSPEQYYRHTVVPFAEKHALTWFPLFQNGIPVTAADLPDVIEEFRKVSDLLQNETLSPEYALLQERLPAILQKLEMLQQNGAYKEIYIG